MFNLTSYIMTFKKDHLSDLSERLEKKQWVLALCSLVGIAANVLNELLKQNEE